MASRRQPTDRDTPPPATEPDKNQQLLRSLHVERQKRQTVQSEQAKKQQDVPKTPVKSATTTGRGSGVVPRPQHNARASSTPAITQSAPVKTHRQQQTRQQKSPPASLSVWRTHTSPGEIARQPSSLEGAHNPRQREVECYVCLDDVPAENAIPCQSLKAKHHLCKPCAKEYVENELGLQRTVIKCGGLDCRAMLPKKDIAALLDTKLVQRWDILVAQKTVDRLQIQDMTKCPFCEFQCILPPASQQPLFVCQSGQGGCGKVSCRLCDKEEHPLRKCEEAITTDSKGKQKSNVEKARQELAEALSEALIQKCNKCLKKFVKEYGCNKMTCPSCGNMQCYSCGGNVSKSVGDAHYSQASKCKMFDNTAVAEEKKVKEAEVATIKRLLAKYPGLKASDLQINVSNQVQDDEAKRRKLWEHPELLLEDGYIEGEDPDALGHVDLGPVAPGPVGPWPGALEPAAFEPGALGPGNNGAIAAVGLEDDFHLAEQLYMQDLADMEQALTVNGRNGFSRNAALNLHPPGPAHARLARNAARHGYGYGYGGQGYGGYGPAYGGPY